VFGDIGKKKKELLEGIRELDAIEECRSLEEDERVRKIDMSKEIENTLLFEELNWRQKSRALWLKEGDKNTNFFHKVANSHRKFNQVNSLKINGEISKNPAEIQEHIVQFYNNLYFENYSWRPRVDGLSFISIEENESFWLERDFEEKEVRDVIRELNGDKAPGPDGFTMAFFQKCWDILKYDIMAVFAEFHSRGKFEKSFNDTFISLIPKKTGVMEVKDFRPISLIGGIYKIISKVLANRFKSVLGNIISPTLRMRILAVDKSWILCLLLMNVWIVRSDRGIQDSCAR